MCAYIKTRDKTISIKNCFCTVFKKNLQKYVFQLTDRAFVIVYTSNSNVTIDPDFLIRLAVRRAEVRVLSTSGTESQNSITLSLVGNGIPIAINGAKDFENVSEIKVKIQLKMLISVPDILRCSLIPITTIPSEHSTTSVQCVPNRSILQLYANFYPSRFHI